jgi:putative DNA primase/helicase
VSFKRQKKDWRELGTSKLTARARKYLDDRAIPIPLARAANLRSLTAEETARLWPDCESESLLVPFSETYGSARIFDPPDGGKFRTTPGKGARLYLPDIKVASKQKEALGVEGPIKALAAIAHGRAAFGITGCWNWQKDRQPLTQLRRYVRQCGIDTIVPVFDADITENNNVLLPYLLFGDWLQQQGKRVLHVRIPKVKGAHAGIDDLIAAKGIAAFDELTRHDWDSEAVEKLRVSVMRTTEGGLAAMFAMRYVEDVRYDPVEDDWYMWNGALLVRQPRRLPDVQEAMKDTVRSIITDANGIKNEQRRKSLIHWASKCDSKNVMRGALELASSDPRIRVDRRTLDADPYLLGTQGGILNLRTQALIKHHPRERLVTSSVGVRYIPGAECPRWLAFIEQITQTRHETKKGKVFYEPDAEQAAFMQLLAGYILSGANPERLIFFLFGEGRNGKSVFIETMLRLMGDYGYPAKSELIMTSRAARDAESAQPFMLQLRGRRYITAAEVREGMELDAALVKTLTGGDEWVVRGLHAQPVRFTVFGKFVIRCNLRPIIKGGDQAIWDRVVEIPFDLRLEDHEQDTELQETLKSELPGILNWALEGFRLYHEEGYLKQPDRVKDQTARYRYAMDSLSQWMDECVRIDHNDKTRTLVSALRGSYVHWCERQTKLSGTLISPVSAQALNKKFEASGCVQKPSNGQTRWHGVRLNKED